MRPGNDQARKEPTKWGIKELSWFLGGRGRFLDSVEMNCSVTVVTQGNEVLLHIGSELGT
jgi:hypothetical protein